MTKKLALNSKNIAKVEVAVKAYFDGLSPEEREETQANLATSLRLLRADLEKKNS